MAPRPGPGARRVRMGGEDGRRGWAARVHVSTCVRARGHEGGLCKAVSGRGRHALTPAFVRRAPCAACWAQGAAADAADGDTKPPAGADAAADTGRRRRRRLCRSHRVRAVAPAPGTRVRPHGAPQLTQPHGATSRPTCRPNPSRVFVHVGLGVWPSLTLDEALAFLDRKDAASARYGPMLTQTDAMHCDSSTPEARGMCAGMGDDGRAPPARPLEQAVERVNELQANIYMVRVAPCS